MGSLWGLLVAFYSKFFFFVFFFLLLFLFFFFFFFVMYGRNIIYIFCCNYFVNNLL